MILTRALVLLCLLSIHFSVFATYTKVSNSGKALPDNAPLGRGPEDWACTYDSNTKLIWEVKTTDGGLRDQKWTYTWYDSNRPDDNLGTSSGTTNCKTSGRCDTEKFTQDVNTQGLCGAKDWRMPAIEELRELVYCYSGQGNPTAVSALGCQGTYQNPTINSQYFPNTQSTWFWSASVYTGNPFNAWFVYFNFGSDYYNPKSGKFAVRLVRGGQSFDPSDISTNTAPIARFNTNPTSGSAPLTVNLDASASSDVDGSVVTYVWTSSDGSAIANGKISSVTFKQAGTFTISLTVADDKGATGTLSKTITVSQPNSVPASTNGTGYIEGSILDACNQKPLKSVRLSFNGTPQQSDRDGHYVIELNSGIYTVSASYAGYNSDSRTIDLSADETRIGNFNLTPTSGCGNVQPAKTKQALIIAGSGPKLPSGDNHIWESTQALADRAYTSLRLQNFKREEIRYLSVDSTPRDADGDGTNDINSAATLDNAQQAFTQWAGGVEQVVVYFIGHGGVGTFQLNRDEQLKPAQLKLWLDTLQSKLIKDQRGQPGKLTLVIDACKSGSFVAPLAASNRYIVASTQPDLDAIISNKDGSNSFSYHFWGQIGFKDGWLSTAFQQARQSMSSELVDRGKTQRAILDADGSGDDTTEADYAVVGNYCYGNCTPHASVPVVIESVSPLNNLNGSLSRTLKVRASKDIAKAWVSIQRPDYHFPTDGTAINTLLTVNLTCDGSNTCQTNYNNFNLNDNYQVTFNVIDKDGNTAVPYTATLYQSGISASNEKKAAPAIYEPTTGVLTLKDVLAGDQHYYVELKDQGGYKFALQNIFQLTEAATDAPARFDGHKVSISSVYAFGQRYDVNLESNGATFDVSKATLK